MVIETIIKHKLLIIIIIFLTMMMIMVIISITRPITQRKL